MLRRLLNPKGDYRNLIKAAHDLAVKTYSDIITITYTSVKETGTGGTGMWPYAPFPLKAYVGVDTVFKDYENGEMCDHVTEADVVSVIVATFHECRHAEVFEQMRYDKSDDMRYMSMAHVATLGNDWYNRHNWPNLITEVDAEYNGVKNAYGFLSEYYDEKRAEKMILRYVNSQAKKRYCISDVQYSSLSEVYEAFENAYEESKHCHNRKHGGREYWDGPNIPKKDNELLYTFVDTFMDDNVRYDWIAMRDSYEKDKKVAAICYHKHPEYEGYYAAQEGIDFSLDVVFGPNWQKQETIDPVLKRQQEIEANISSALGQRYTPVKRDMQSAVCGLRELDYSGYEDKQDEFQ